MKLMTIAFLNGNRALAVRAPAAADGLAIAKALRLLPSQAFLLIHGGASGIPSAKMDQLRNLLAEGVARLAAEEGIAIINGGTQAGVMRIIGEEHARAGSSAPLIGVCPATLVSWPGGPSGSDLVPLEPNHTHFVLTDGEHWGAETEAMFALAAALSRDGLPSLAILANGGPIAYDEVLQDIRQGREIIVIRGSGRLADAIAAAVAGDDERSRIRAVGLHLASLRERSSDNEPSDDELAAIVREGHITLFDITGEPAALATLIRRKLFEGK